MERFEVKRLTNFFQHITSRFPAKSSDVCSLLITHLLAERPAFIDAISSLTTVKAVLPKPKSIHTEALGTVSKAYNVDTLSRERFTDPNKAISYIEERAAGRDLVLLDVGGYFAPVLEELCDHYSGKIVGVVEDTENGYRRYLELGKPPCPVYSVARSPLKEPEDHLVGQSIVFSAESLMRSRGDIMPGRAAAVIGFGKLGSSIARTLHAKGVRVTVFDQDPIRSVQALSQGFNVSRSRGEALQRAGVVMCATGNLALRHDDFSLLANGSYLASVTSSEDELELNALAGLYDTTHVNDQVTRYGTVGHYFYVLAGGNAVNFLHGACVGPFIFLVQAEILTAVAALCSKEIEPGFYEMADSTRQFIADTWLTHFKFAGASH